MTTTSRVPVDHGYAWVICGGSAMMFFVTSGVTKSLGVMLLEFQEHFGSDPALTSLTVALVAAGFFTCVFVSNTLGLFIGNRNVSIGGAVLACLSMLATAYSPNIYYVIVFLGLFSGIAYSAMYGPPLVILSAYFKERRALATSMAVAGGSIGTLSIPLLINYSIYYYGYQGGMLLMTGILLHTIPASMLLRPPEWWDKRGRSTATSQQPPHSQCTRFLTVLKVMASKELMTSRLFQMFILCIILGHMGYYGAVIFLPSAAKSFFQNQTLAVTLVSVMGVSDFVGRILGGYLTDLRILAINDVMGVCLIVPGVVTVVMGIVPVVWLMYVASVIIGIFSGSYSALVTPCIVEYFGLAKVSPGFGIITLFMGIFITPWPTTLAYIFKATGTYKSVLIIAGCFSILSGIIFFFLRYFVHRNRREETVTVDIPDEVKDTESAV